MAVRFVPREWDAVELSGDHTGKVELGHRIRIYGADGFETQAERAAALQNYMDSLINARGNDGVHFVCGWEHWAYFDHALLDGREIGQFGLVTQTDNAYDGGEARRAVRKDSNGRFIGGEDQDYGDFLTPLSLYLHSLYDRLIPAQVPPTATITPTLTLTATNTTIPSNTATPARDVRRCQVFDLNNDYQIDLEDCVLFILAYGASEGDQNYEARIDYNHDKIIDTFDVSAFSSCYGASLW